MRILCGCSLDRALIFEWYMIRFAFKSGHQNTCITMTLDYVQAL